MYKAVGTFPTRVTVTDAGVGIASAAGTATVTEAAITGTGGHINGIKNGPAAGALAIFTDGNPSEPISSYTAVVNWGDGTPPSTVPGDGSVKISGSAGNVLVTGSHVYGATGGYQITVTLNNTVTVVGSATVGNLYLGNLANLNIASFTTTQPNSTAGEFIATINWGDGMTSPGAVTGSGGSYQVNGTHTYGSAPTAPVHVQIVDPFMDTLTADKTVIVVDGQIIGFGNELAATGGVTLNNVSPALFLDTNPQENGSRYTATETWGDGTSPTSGTVGGGNDILKVSGSHTYAAMGLYSVATTLWLGTNLVGAAVGEAEAVKPAVPPYTVDLDVNNNMTITDPLDGAKNYLPGYFDCNRFL